MATTIIKSGNSDNQAIVTSDGRLLVSTDGGGGGGSNASVGVNGATGPGSSTQIAAVDPDGNLEALKTDENGALLVNTTGEITGVVVSHEAGLSNFQTSQYDVDTTLIQITPTPLANRSSISLKVHTVGGGFVYIGNDNTLTISNGYPLSDGETLQMDLTPANSIYAISDIPGQTVYVLEIA